jgi:hypothetical protein
LDVLGVALANLGMTFQVSGDLAGTRAALDEALVLYREIDDPA